MGNAGGGKKNKNGAGASASATCQNVGDVPAPDPGIWATFVASLVYSTALHQDGLRRSTIPRSGFLPPVKEPWTLGNEVFMGIAAIIAAMAVTSTIAVPGGFNPPGTSAAAGSSVMLSYGHGWYANIAVFYYFTAAVVITVFCLFIGLLKGWTSYMYNLFATILLVIVAWCELVALATLFSIFLTRQSFMSIVDFRLLSHPLDSVHLSFLEVGCMA